MKINRQVILILFLFLNPIFILADDSHESVSSARQTNTGAAILYPNKKLTPGKIDPSITKEQVCTPGFTKKIRNVTAATKKQVFESYGMHNPVTADYEVDHYVSLELAGSNDAENLWPQAYQPFPGAREKDVVETNLHRQVCIGKLTLKQAQDTILGDWYAYYQKIKSEPQTGDMILLPKVNTPFTDTERNEIIDRINDACADAWCERNSTLTFQELNCQIDPRKCSLGYKYNKDEFSGKTIQTGACPIPGTFSYSDFVGTEKATGYKTLYPEISDAIDKCLWPG